MSMEIDLGPVSRKRRGTLTLFGGDAVELVPQGENSDADHGVQGLVSVVRKGKRTRHHAQTHASDRARHHEAVLDYASAEGEASEDHGEAEANLMDDRRSKKPTSSRKHAEKNRRRQAMHKAKAGQANGQPVQASGVQGDCHG
jgi:hypothetical protein